MKTRSQILRGCSDLAGRIIRKSPATVRGTMARCFNARPFVRDDHDLLPTTAPTVVRIFEFKTPAPARNRCIDRDAQYRQTAGPVRDHGRSVVEADHNRLTVAGQPQPPQPRASVSDRSSGHRVPRRAIHVPALHQLERRDLREIQRVDQIDAVRPHVEPRVMADAEVPHRVRRREARECERQDCAQSYSEHIR